MKYIFSRSYNVLLALFICSGLLAWNHEGRANSATSQGGTCADEQSEKQDPTPKRDPVLQLQESMAMATKLQDFMKKGGYRVAIVSRVGSNLGNRWFMNPQQQKYSHAGFLVPAGPDAKDGFKFVHVLNTCGGPTSDVYEQGVARFFTDDLYEYDILVTVPSEALQAKIEEAVRVQSKSLHNPNYSNIAHPYGQRYQNSNLWLLSVVAAAQTGAQTIEASQEAFRKKGFTPSRVKIKFFEKLGASMGMMPPNVKLDEHPRSERSSGWLSFVSTASVHDYLKRTDAVLVDQAELCPDTGCDIPLE